MFNLFVLQFKVRSKVRPLVSRFVSDERGVTSIEYALLAALIATAIIVGATALGSAVNDKFTSIGTVVKL